MKRYGIWAMFLVALLLVVGCRPTEDGGADDPTTADLEIDACKPNESDCGDETAEAEATEAVVTEAPANVPAATEVPQATEVPPVEIDLGEDPFAVRETDWVKGPEDAILTLVEYADFF